MRFVGVDPGLRETGLCSIEGSDIRCMTVKLDRADWSSMTIAVEGAITFAGHADAIGIEDFVFRSPKISRGMVKHGADVGKLIGWLVGRLDAAGIPTLLVPAHESKRDMLFGAAAKAAGLPGKNDHERSAYAVAMWLKGTMRLAGSAR